MTLTHTAGVLVLGLTLPLATHLAGETVLTWLGLASGLLVTAIGMWLLHSALLNRPTHHHGQGHGHAPARPRTPPRAPSQRPSAPQRRSCP